MIPTLNTSGYDWSLGLSVRWLLFDAGTTSGETRALQRRVEAAGQDYAARRNAIRLRLEAAFFNHEASLAKLASARRGSPRPSKPSETYGSATKRGSRARWISRSPRSA